MVSALKLLIINWTLTSVYAYAQKRQKLPAQGITLGYNGLKPYALKGQKLLAQGTTLGYNGIKPAALFYSNWASFERIF